LADFYNVNITNSFGSLIQTVLSLEANILDCVGKDEPKNVNCTVEEIVPVQWGESYLTNSKPLYPINGDTVFIPKAWSIYNWGGVPNNPPGIFAAPELSAYSEPPYYRLWDRRYSLKQIKAIMSPNYSWYGNGNIYNSA